MSQRDSVFLAASGWVVDAGMEGLEHEHTRMPDVPGPDEVSSYAEVFDDTGRFPMVGRRLGKNTRACCT